MPSVTIIGIGRVGGAFELAFQGSEYKVEHLIGRRVSGSVLSFDEIDRISSDIILITTPDAEIKKVAAVLAGKIEGKPVVLHTSGALSSDELSLLGTIGCSTGSVHPLASISTPDLGVKRFAGAYFCVEGDKRAVAAANKIVEFLGGQPFEIAAANKALYHAAAVTACGHLTALLDLSFSMMTKAGVDSAMASKILMPLVKSTVENIEEQGTVMALTGTFARADAEGLERQLTAFENKLTVHETRIYLDLAEHSLDIASRQGADAKKIAKVAERISMAKTKLR